MLAIQAAPRSAARPLRVLIVDDSLVARTVFARMLGERPEFVVAGVAANAESALALLDGLTVDLILLDVEMPGMGGLNALPQLSAKAQGAPVLIVSAACAAGAEASVRAMTLGAADTLLKPQSAGLGDAFADALAERLLAIGRDANGDAAAVAIRRSASAGTIACLGIGASTGGPHAITAFCGALDPGFVAPILVTQHLPPLFMPYFARQLAEAARRPVTVAVDGDRLVDGHILLAPGDAHLAVTRDAGGPARVVLDRAAAPTGCSPSLDPMLSAMAATFGPAAVGVVLTGMGRDGLIGARALVAAGGEMLAQDEASAVVWGMPGVIANAGLATAIAPPDALAHRVCARGRTRAWR